MSDLSRLLGDVYGASTPPAEDAEVTEPTTPMATPAAADDPPAPPADAVDAGRPAAPGWADDAVLDEAFADWVPGPPSDADAEERDILADIEPAEPVAEPIDIDAWFGTEPVEAIDEVGEVDDFQAIGTGTEAEAAELDATVAFDDFVPASEPEPEVRAATGTEGAWSRESDDLLPRGRRSRRLSLRR